MLNRIVVRDLRRDEGYSVRGRGQIIRITVDSQTPEGPYEVYREDRHLHEGPLLVTGPFTDKDEALRCGHLIAISDAETYSSKWYLNYGVRSKVIDKTEIGKRAKQNNLEVQASEPTASGR